MQEKLLSALGRMAEEHGPYLPAWLQPGPPAHPQSLALVFPRLPDCFLCSLPGPRGQEVIEGNGSATVCDAESVRGAGSGEGCVRGCVCGGLRLGASRCATPSV